MDKKPVFNTHTFKGICCTWPVTFQVPLCVWAVCWTLNCHLQYQVVTAEVLPPLRKKVKSLPIASLPQLNS